jgi:hypothetical protein
VTSNLVVHAPESLLAPKSCLYLPPSAYCTTCSTTAAEAGISAVTTPGQNLPLLLPDVGSYISCPDKDSSCPLCQLFGMSAKKWDIQDAHGQLKTAIPFNFHTKGMCIYKTERWIKYLLYVLELSSGQPKPGLVVIPIGSKGSRGPTAKLAMSREAEAAGML